MFSLSESNKFMVCTSAVDLRKGVDLLSRMVLAIPCPRPTAVSMFS